MIQIVKNKTMVPCIALFLLAIVNTTNGLIFIRSWWADDKKVSAVIIWKIQSSI